MDKRTKKRGLAAVLGLAGAFGAVLCANMIENWILFPATREIYRDPGEFGWPFEEVWLEVGLERTHAWYVPLEGARGVALFSHGNAGNIADRLESIGLLRNLGFSVFAYDYGGYGKSSGSASEKRCCADVRAAWRHLTETRGMPARQILLFGRSLGGAVTADLAQEVVPAAVVLESTFLSVPDVAKDMFPWLPVQWLVRTQFCTKDKIARFHCPLLVIHSPDDSLIRFHHGKELFERAREPKQFLEIRGGHNDGFVQSMKMYTRGWEEFLAPILPREAADQST